MADQRVTIKLDVNSSGEADITAMQKRLAMLGKENDKFAKQQKLISEHFSKIKDRTDLVSKTFTKMRSGLGTLVGMFSKFNAIITVLATAALPLLNAAFAVGRVAVKAYQGAMQLAAAGVAALAAAVAIGLAAFQEYNAALNSFAYTNSPNFQSQTANASAAMRTLQKDTSLAVFGIKGLNDAFTQVNQSSKFTGESQKMLRSLSDFAAAGGDPAKNIAAAGAFIGLLQKEGKLTNSVLAAGQKIGPAFAKALDEAKKKGMTSAEDLKKMLFSGDLAALGGVTGQAARVRQTLFGQFKSSMGQFMTLGSDIGASLLGPTKKALTTITDSLMSLMRRVGPSIAAFGKGPLMDGFVKSFLKLEEIMITLFRKYLPASGGMIKRFVQAWKEVVFVFEDIVDRLRPFLEYGRAIMDIFGPAFTGIFTRLGEKFGNIGKLIEDNREEFDTFGQNIKRFVDLFFDFGAVLEESFVNALPIINRLADALLTIADAVLSIVGAIGGMGSLGGLASLGLLFGGKTMLGGGKRGKGGMGSKAGNKFRSGVGQGFGAINSGLGRWGALGGGFMPGYQQYGDGQGLRRGISAVGRGFGAMAERTGIAQSAHYGAQFARNLGSSSWNQAYAPYQYQFINQNKGGPMPAGGAAGPPPVNHANAYARNMDAIQNGGTLSKYRAFRDGMGGGLGGSGRLKSAKLAAGTSYKQGRFTKGFAPTGLGAGMASMLASQYMMGKMDFADTGLGNAGKTVSSMGSMVGMVNPLAGLGMTLAGGALGAKTPGGGALMGAGAGAAFGTMVGGPVGAAVGAVIGAAIGGVTGAINRFKGEKKKMKADAQRVGLEVFGGLAQDFIGKGDFSGVKAATGKLRERASYLSGLGLGGMSRDARKIKVEGLRREGKITDTEAETLNAGVNEYVKQLGVQADSIDKVSGVIEKGFNKKIDTMASMTGKSQEELMALANTMGVNLFDATKSVSQAVAEMGLTAQRTAEQIIGSIRDIQQSALDPLRTSIAASEVTNQLAELEIGLASLGASAEPNDLRQYLIDYVDVLNIRNPDSPLTNLAYAQKMLEFSLGKDGMLAGMRGQFDAAGLTNFLPRAGADAREGAIESLSGDIISGFAREGRAVDRDSLISSMAGMSDTEIERLMAQVISGQLFEEATFSGMTYDPKTGRQAGGNDDMSIFNGTVSGIKTEKMSSAEMSQAMYDALSADQKVMYDGIQGAVTAGFNKSPDWYASPPAWYTQESFQAILDADTSTPRGSGDTTSSRLSRTMGRHNYFNSMLTGKRTMTSSYRTTGLGSINSDHVTGRAYDLVGQNLGQYSKLVNDSGGFAEFHGRGGTRHLHVVPGQTPVGDTMVPSIGRMAPQPNGSSVNNYSVVVNGANADANEVANVVIDRIQRLERNARERK